jgi:hypothetical protein
MRQVRLGQTDLKVSTVGLGTWAFGGDWGAADLEQSRAVVHRALELGITLFDSAQGYGFGAAEQLLGEALRQRTRREDVVIATKGGLRMDGDTLVRDAGANWLRAGVESSLRNLGTDYIDLYQVHWPDPRTPAGETAGALDGWSPRTRSGTPESPTTASRRWSSSGRSGGWRPCNRRTTCSDGPLRTTSFGTPQSTTSACWPTGRWPTACSAAG